MVPGQTSLDARDADAGMSYGSLREAITAPQERRGTVVSATAQRMLLARHWAARARIVELEQIPPMTSAESGSEELVRLATDTSSSRGMGEGAERAGNACRPSRRVQCARIPAMRDAGQRDLQADVFNIRHLGDNHARFYLWRREVVDFSSCTTARRLPQGLGSPPPDRPAAKPAVGRAGVFRPASRRRTAFETAIARACDSTAIERWPH